MCVCGFKQFNSFIRFIEVLTENLVQNDQKKGGKIWKYENDIPTPHFLKFRVMCDFCSF